MTKFEVANVGVAIVTIVRGAGGEVRDSEWAELPFFAKFRQGRGNLDAELDPPRSKRDLARDFSSEFD